MTSMQNERYERKSPEFYIISFAEMERCEFANYFLYIYYDYILMFSRYDYI